MSPKRAADADKEFSAAMPVLGKRQKTDNIESARKNPLRKASLTTPKYFEEVEDDDDSPIEQSSLSEEKASDTKKAGREDQDEMQEMQTKPLKGRVPNPDSLRQLLRGRAEANKRAKLAQAEIAQLKQDNEKQAKRIKILQNAQLRGSGQGRDFIQDDHTIRENVRQLFGMIENFVYEWVSSGYIMKVVGEESARTIVSMLTGHDSRYPCRVLRPDDEEKFLWHPAGARKSVESIVAQIVADGVLLRPFYFLFHEKVGAGTTMEHALICMRDRLNGTLHDTKVWYSRTLRAIYASHQYNGPITEPIIDDKFERCRQRSHSRLIRQSLDDPNFPLAKLLRSCTENQKIERHEELLSIFQAAAKLSLQLWAQDAEVQLYFSLDEFDEIFNSTSTTMELDNSNDMKESIPSALDMPVGLIVRPQAVMLRYHPNGAPTSQLAATKASVIVFVGKKWKLNKSRFLESDEVATKDRGKEQPQDRTLSELVNLDTEVLQDKVTPSMPEEGLSTNDRESMHTTNTGASTKDTSYVIIDDPSEDNGAMNEESPAGTEGVLSSPNNHSPDQSSSSAAATMLMEHRSPITTTTNSLNNVDKHGQLKPIETINVGYNFVSDDVDSSDGRKWDEINKDADEKRSIAQQSDVRMSNIADGETHPPLQPSAVSTNDTQHGHNAVTGDETSTDEVQLKMESAQDSVQSATIHLDPTRVLRDTLPAPSDSAVASLTTAPGTQGASRQSRSGTEEGEAQNAKAPRGHDKNEATNKYPQYKDYRNSSSTQSSQSTVQEEGEDSKKARPESQQARLHAESAVGYLDGKYDLKVNGNKGGDSEWKY